jgi:hypothetical protein
VKKEKNMEILLLIIGFVVLLAIGAVYASSKLTDEERAELSQARYCCQCGHKLSPTCGVTKTEI